MKVILVKLSRERLLIFLILEGNVSNKEELRGNVFLLECIVEGLFILIIYWVKEDGMLFKNRIVYKNFEKIL